MTRQETIQKYNTWNSLIPFYQSRLEEARQKQNKFFIEYLEHKVEEARSRRDKAFDSLPKYERMNLLTRN